jgi:hypothetical protein
MSESDKQESVNDSGFPRRKPGQSLFDYLDRVRNFTAPRLKDGPSYEELMDELYAPETGLPR